jgi:hypothetical protein
MKGSVGGPRAVVVLLDRGDEGRRVTPCSFRSLDSTRMGPAASNVIVARWVPRSIHIDGLVSTTARGASYTNVVLLARSARWSEVSRSECGETDCGGAKQGVVTGGLTCVEHSCCAALAAS